MELVEANEARGLAINNLIEHINKCTSQAIADGSFYVSIDTLVNEHIYSTIIKPFYKRLGYNIFYIKGSITLSWF